MEKEAVTLAPARWTLCPFRHDETKCVARGCQNVGKCNPEPGRSWPRRCWLKEHDVLTKQGI